MDFHSWRRKFVQALTDIGLNAQQAQKLAGHADLAAHERYLRNTTRTLVIPSEALPDLTSTVCPSRCRNSKPRIHNQALIQYATSDSNARPLAPEANALSS